MDLGIDPKAFKAFGIVPHKEISRIYIDSNSNSNSDFSDARTGLNSSSVFLNIDSLPLSPILTPILQAVLESIVKDVSLPSPILLKQGNTIRARILTLKRYNNSVLI